MKLLITAAVVLAPLALVCGASFALCYACLKPGDVQEAAEFYRPAKAFRHGAGK